MNKLTNALGAIAMLAAGTVVGIDAEIIPNPTIAFGITAAPVTHTSPPPTVTPKVAEQQPSPSGVLSPACDKPEATIACHKESAAGGR
jgi:hypothetical protein